MFDSGLASVYVYSSADYLNVCPMHLGLVVDRPPSMWGVLIWPQREKGRPCGLPDLDKKGEEAVLWQYFDCPDYVWLQEVGSFAQDFQQANSKYTLMFNSVTTRRAVYGYLAKLSKVYEASTIR